ncbi:RNA polymerase sigma factor, sigma-70 family [Methylorubrum salsuginis]|uniref:RNA polymerase sigma factor n=2 Tax=Methylorubrum salsuginis TaxID=414703 RepID=A0A1I4MM89_9HYPH|nr:RNA polymerase sigma factor, sigma-70 family [Methylorubrum salsuginis]
MTTELPTCRDDQRADPWHGLIPTGTEQDRWSPSVRPADARRPAVAGAIGDASGSSPMGIMGAQTAAQMAAQIAGLLGRSGRAGCAAADIPAHLTGPLRDHYGPVADAPLPEALAALLRRFETGTRRRADATVRDALVACVPALRVFALSLSGNPARAEDLVQEALVRAWANREKFVPGTNFSAWIFTILRNHFYSECRRKRREVEDAEGHHAASLTTPAEQEHAVVLGSVMALIGTLPAPQRQALLLVGADGLTYEEAAARLDCQVGTVKSRVSRARRFLAESLGRRGEEGGEEA